MSQSITSDRISESSILRAAGNIIGHDVEDWLPGGDDRRVAVEAAVATARALAAEVRRTGPPDTAAHVLDLSPSDAYRLGWHDGKADRLSEHALSGAAGCLYASAQCGGRVLPGTGLCEAHSGALEAPSAAGEPATAAERQAARDENASLKAQLADDRVGARRELLLRSGKLATLEEGWQQTAEQQARDLLQRLGAVAPEQGQWSSGDLAELANLFNEVRRLQVARIGDSETINRLMTENAKFQQVRHDEQRCLLHHLFDSEHEREELRRRVAAPADAALRASHDALLEEVRGLRPEVERLKQDRVGAANATVTRLRADVEAFRARAERAEARLDEEHALRVEQVRALNEELLHLKAVRDESAAELQRKLADAQRELQAQKGLRPDERRAADLAVARALRRCAEEILNSLRDGTLHPRDVLHNCMAWYRAQADSLDPSPAQLEAEASVFTGGGRGGKADRLRHSSAGVQEVTREAGSECPTCASPDRRRHPAVQHEGEVQPCGDPWHGVPHDARRIEVQAARAWQERTPPPASPDARFGGCPVCQAWEDGKSGEELLGACLGWTHAAARDKLASTPEPHMFLCEMLGVPHDHEDVR